MAILPETRRWQRNAALLFVGFVVCVIILMGIVTMKLYRKLN